MKKGFTLVELSIVLVIIGLLIGGILVGQSLIESAKLSKEVSRLSQYSIAAVQFKDKFKQEPGDTILFPNPGNNDQENDDTVGTCPAQTTEIYSAWSHLSQSKILSENYTWPNPGINCSGNVNFAGVTPTNKLSTNGDLKPYELYYRRTGFYYNNKGYEHILAVGYDPEMLWGLQNKLGNSTTNSTFLSFTSVAYNPCTKAGVDLEIATNGAAAGFCWTNIFFNSILN